MAASPTRVRWDRLGRVALLCVAVLVLYLYVGPAANWVSAYKESKRRKHEVATLKHAHARLVARRDALRKASTLEAEARSLGMVRAGEKAYVISGLPKR